MNLLCRYSIIILVCASSCRLVNENYCFPSKTAPFSEVLLPQITCKSSTVYEVLDQVVREMDKSGKAVRIVFSLSEPSVIEGSDPFRGHSLSTNVFSGVYTNIPLTVLLDDMCAQMGLTWTSSVNSIVIFKRRQE